MKNALVFVFVALATIVYAVPKPQTYSTKYDNIDLDAILNNDRLLDNYIACVEGLGKCTPEGEELKKQFKDGLETCCEKCSEKQKEGTEKVINFLETKKPEKLKELKAKYDPNGVYEKKCRG